MIITRRTLLRSMLAAPLVVAAPNLMRLRGTKMIQPGPSVWADGFVSIDGFVLVPGETTIILPKAKIGGVYTIISHHVGGVL